jgi:putative transferase (TIGR04331 family)
VLTPDEATWSRRKPNLFLTEWSKLGRKEPMDERPDDILAVPYGIEKAEKDEDFFRARGIEEAIFPTLCALLNSTQKTQLSCRSWKIILGFWMQHYVRVILNRYRSLSSAFSSYEIRSVTFHGGCSYSLAAQDYEQFIWALNDSRWNEELFKHLFPVIAQSENVEKVLLPPGSTTSFYRSISYIKKKPLRESFVQCLAATRFLVKDTDAFFINPLLPKKIEALVRLSALEWPLIWEREHFQSEKPVDRNLRKLLGEQLVQALPPQRDGLTRIVAGLLFEALPLAHLEHFHELSDFVSRLRWPSRPKFIFASANFDSDEVFKMWVAKRTQQRVPYYTGQHGSYGHVRHEMNPSVEEATSDKFLTWGWSEPGKQYAPVGCFKFAGKKPRRQKNKIENIMLVQTCLGSLFTTYDRSYTHSKYFEDQIKFASTLNSDNRRRLKVRLHSLSNIYGFSEKCRWLDFDANTEFEESGKPLVNIASDFRLIVNSYDSTAILELLYFNLPSVAFWQKPLDHLRESAVPYYEMLLGAGLLFDSSSGCAAFINSHYDIIDDWWHSAPVQNARMTFVDRYAKEIKKPLRTLKNLLYTKNPLSDACKTT